MTMLSSVQFIEKLCPNHECYITKRKTNENSIPLRRKSHWSKKHNPGNAYRRRYCIGLHMHKSSWMLLQVSWHCCSRRCGAGGAASPGLVCEDSLLLCSFAHYYIIIIIYLLIIILLLYIYVGRMIDFALTQYGFASSLHFIEVKTTTWYYSAVKKVISTWSLQWIGYSTSHASANVLKHN